MFLNLFIAVILQEFDTSEELEKGRLTGAAFDRFRKHWAKYDPKGTCFIRIDKFSEFLADLDPPLGHRNCNFRETKELLKHIKQREMNVFEDNTYHFYDVSNALASYNYHTEDTKKLRLETHDMCFKQLEKAARKKFPALRNRSIYTSRHMYYLLRIQRFFRTTLLRSQHRNGRK